MTMELDVGRLSGALPWEKSTLFCAFTTWTRANGRSGAPVPLSIARSIYESKYDIAFWLMVWDGITAGRSADRVNMVGGGHCKAIYTQKERRLSCIDYYRMSMMDRLML